MPRLTGKTGGLHYAAGAQVPAQRPDPLADGGVRGPVRGCARPTTQRADRTPASRAGDCSVHRGRRDRRRGAVEDRAGLGGQPGRRRGGRPARGVGEHDRDRDALRGLKTGSSAGRESRRRSTSGCCSSRSPGRWPGCGGRSASRPRPPSLSCCANFGIAIAARMPMITTTISSSIRVKPSVLRAHVRLRGPILDELRSFAANRCVFQENGRQLPAAHPRFTAWRQLGRSVAGRRALGLERRRSGRSPVPT